MKTINFKTFLYSQNENLDNCFSNNRLSMPIFNRIYIPADILEQMLRDDITEKLEHENY